MSGFTLEMPADGEASCGHLFLVELVRVIARTLYFVETKIESQILKFSRFDTAFCAFFVLTLFLIMACDSSKPTSTFSEPKPNFVGKAEVVLDEGDPESKTDRSAMTAGDAINFRYKVEIAKEYARTDPRGAARAYAVVDADTIIASTQEWISAPGSEHSVSLFAFASHSTTGNNPAKASVHVQCVWE